VLKTFKTIEHVSLEICHPSQKNAQQCHRSVTVTTQPEEDKYSLLQDGRANILSKMVEQIADKYSLLQERRVHPQTRNIIIL